MGLGIEEAEDAVSYVFEKSFVRRAGIIEATMQNYCMRAVARRSIDVMRASYMAPKSFSIFDYSIKDESAAADFESMLQDNSWVSVAVQSQPAHLRDAIMLCVVHELPNKEAAERLGITRFALDARLRKAKRLIRRKGEGREDYL